MRRLGEVQLSPQHHRMFLRPLVLVALLQAVILTDLHSSRHQHKPEVLTSKMFYEISNLFSVLTTEVRLSVWVERLDLCQYETTGNHDNSL